MRRFLTNKVPLLPGEASLSEKESHHGVRVLRLKPKDKIVLFNGKGEEADAEITTINKGIIHVRISTVRKEIEGASAQVTLAITVIKPDRMEFAIEKLTELGVRTICPITSERCVIKMDEARWGKKVERWRKIAEQSCKQCGLNRVPDIENVVSFNNLIDEFRAYDLILIPTLHGNRKSLGESIQGYTNKRILVLIGPEGDFTPEEVGVALGAGAKPVTLGKNVLRAETAALYVLSVLNHTFDTPSI